MSAQNFIQKARILVRKTVVILSPASRSQHVIQARNIAAPRNFLTLCQEFRVLIHHRRNDRHKRLVRSHHAMTAGQNITLEQALKRSFVENFHHATIARQIFFPRVDFSLPTARSRFENRVELVRISFVWTEKAESFGIFSKNIAQKFADRVHCERFFGISRRDVRQIEQLEVFSAIDQ